MRPKIIGVSALALLTACAATDSGGVVLGMKGSPIWNSQAPPREVAAYYDGMRDHELCMTWNKRDSAIVRRHISDALERRAKPPGLCYNPELDALKEASERVSRPVYVPPPPIRRPVSCTSSTYGKYTTTNCY